MSADIGDLGGRLVRAPGRVTAGCGQGKPAAALRRGERPGADLRAHGAASAPAYLWGGVAEEERKVAGQKGHYVQRYRGMNKQEKVWCLIGRASM